MFHAPKLADSNCTSLKIRINISSLSNLIKNCKCEDDETHLSTRFAHRVPGLTKVFLLNGLLPDRVSVLMQAGSGERADASIAWPT